MSSRSVGEVVSLDEIESRSRSVNVPFYPMLRQPGELGRQEHAPNALQETTRKLELAGKAGQIDAPSVPGLPRFVASGVLGVLVFLIAPFSIFCSVPIANALFVWHHCCGAGLLLPGRCG